MRHESCWGKIHPVTATLLILRCYPKAKTF
jgi:hypothetical protein